MSSVTIAPPKYNLFLTESLLASSVLTRRFLDPILPSGPIKTELPYRSPPTNRGVDQQIQSSLIDFLAATQPSTHPISPPSPPLGHRSSRLTSNKAREVRQKTPRKALKATDRKPKTWKRSTSPMSQESDSEEDGLPFPDTSPSNTTMAMEEAEVSTPEPVEQQSPILFDTTNLQSDHEDERKHEHEHEHEHDSFIGLSPTQPARRKLPPKTLESILNEIKSVRHKQRKYERKLQRQNEHLAKLSRQVAELCVQQRVAAP